MEFKIRGQASKKVLEFWLEKDEHGITLKAGLEGAINSETNILSILPEGTLKRWCWAEIEGIKTEKDGRILLIP